MPKLKPSWKTSINKGSYQRKTSQFRHWITADGQAGPSGEAGFIAEANRYHLYISHACPWAHRTLIFRQLKGLEALISVSVVHPDMHEQGWTFANDAHSSGRYATTGDTLYGNTTMSQLYELSAEGYTGNITVPVLWDKQLKQIVSNESSEIIRMLNTAFNAITDNTLDFYPAALQGDIDDINDLVYHGINNGVYKTGFATTQQAYEAACESLFSALDEIDQRLSKQRFLVGTHK